MLDRHFETPAPVRAAPPAHQAQAPEVAVENEWLNQPAPNRQELVAFYGDKLASPNKLPTVYPKANHPLMARTNFKKMWEEVQAAHAVPPDVDAAFCKDLILGWTQRKASDYVYPGGYYDDALDPDLWNTQTEQAKNAIVKGPTVGDWLDSIFVEGAQAPTMEGRIAPHLPMTPEKRGMGALKKTEEVGTAERRWQAPIFEYRFFEGLYPPEQWGALAARVGAVVRKINL